MVCACGMPALLGGSCVVISRVISRISIVIIHTTGFLTALRSTHAPPSTLIGKLFIQM